MPLQFGIMIKKKGKEQSKDIKVGTFLAMNFNSLWDSHVLRVCNEKKNLISPICIKYPDLNTVY